MAREPEPWGGVARPRCEHAGYGRVASEDSPDARDRRPHLRVVDARAPTGDDDGERIGAPPREARLEPRGA
jgi:hypothetical protein